jgi:flavodoxin
MKALVCYATHKGTTRRIAEAIAEGLRATASTGLIAVEDGVEAVTPDVDLLVIGGPTEGHGMTAEMSAFLDQLPRLEGHEVATFDTRVHWPRWLSGSAAEDIRDRLSALGALPPIRTETFIVTMGAALLPEELVRAQAWGARLGTRVPVAA